MALVSNLRKLFPTDWENLRVLQLLFTEGEAQSGQPAPEHPGRHESEQDPAQRDLDTSGQLPTIPEGPEEDADSQGLEAYLQNECPELQHHLEATRESFETVLESVPRDGSRKADHCAASELADGLPLSLLSTLNTYWSADF